MATLIELCVSDAAGARIAADAGCDRIEICRELEVGGLTPSPVLVEAACDAAPRLPVQVLIRCRAGDFCYSADEVAQMEREIAAVVAATDGRRPEVGVVIGALTPSGGVDREALARWVDSAAGRPVTFHRASDELRDLTGTWPTLAACGIDRVLTTGGHPRRANVAQLRALRALSRPIVLASGGLRSGNVREVIARTGVEEVHMRAPNKAGGTDPDEVARIVRAVRHAPA